MKLAELKASRPIKTEPETTTRRHRRLSSEQTAALVASYEAGSSLNELSDVFRITHQTASAILKRCGVTPRWQKRTPELESEACRLYQTGLSLAAVGTRLGLSASTVRNILKDKEVATRPVGTNQWT